MIVISKSLSSVSFYFTLFSVFNSIFCDSRFTLEAHKTHLSSKTPYRFIENLDTSKIQYEGCVPRKLWTMIRHGTRTTGSPADKEIRCRLLEVRDSVVKNFNSNYRNSLNENFNIDDLKKWQPHPALNEGKTLTTAGEKEMVDLARNYRKRFPDLFPKSWSNSSYFFKYTDTERTQASAEWFVKGLFGESGAKKVWFPTPLLRDPIIRFYKLCDQWRLQVKNNSEIATQFDKFLQTEVFIDVIKALKARFGLASLDIDDVRSMYTACSFETAWEDSIQSPWCTMFTEYEMKVLEYVEDLEYYWVDGYGHELTPKIGCVLLEDAIQYLKANTNVRPPAIVYFSHSGAMLKFLSNLGLYKDSIRLKYDNYFENENRMWRTSKIDSFGSNIAFVLFDCEDGHQHVLTMHQERPITLPGCPTDKHLCPLSVIEKTYQKNIKECNFDKLCRVGITDQSILQKVGAYLWHMLHTIRETYFPRLGENLSKYWSIL